MENTEKIILFDIDDTLIKSKAKIYVLDEQNNLVRKLTPAQYNHYKRKEGEHFNYDEFDNEEILNKAKLTKIWKDLKNFYDNGANIGIVTARGDKEMLIRFFMNRGMNINRYLVFAVGSSKSKFKGKIKDRKRQVIEHLSARGYKNFVFYDDNEDNLKEVEQMQNRIGVNIETVQAVV